MIMMISLEKNQLM